MVTFEEARRCPKCDQPGEEQTNEVRKVDSSTIHVIRCMNERCRWFDTDWIIQVEEDGNVPVRQGLQPKSFPPFRGISTRAAQEEVEGIKDAERRRG